MPLLISKGLINIADCATNNTKEVEELANILDKAEALESFSKKYGNHYAVYPNSVKESNDNLFFMVKGLGGKHLIVLGEAKISQEFEGKSPSSLEVNEKKVSLRIVDTTHRNLVLLRKIFTFLSPSVCGRRASFSTGDRLGVATPGHIRAFKGRDLFPVLAQESVRELTRTDRTWENVLDDTIWGCFEAGYEGSFGADADHVKKIQDLQEAIDAGYTMFTIDSSDNIDDLIRHLSIRDLQAQYNSIPERKKLEELYLGKTYTVNGYRIRFTSKDLVKLAVTYYHALRHMVKCYRYLRENAKREFDLELSVDETLDPTTPIGHIFIVEELLRNEVEFTNLALHYVGVFQKAVDYIGDVEEFAGEMKIHAAIAKQFGGYKLSLHSAGLKYSVFPSFARENQGSFHAKISTSWLEAMRIILRKNPGL